MYAPRGALYRSPKEKDPTVNNNNNIGSPKAKPWPPERAPGVYGKVASETGHIQIVQ